jgi:hypothetical protein
MRTALLDHVQTSLGLRGKPQRRFARCLRATPGGTLTDELVQAATDLWESQTTVNLGADQSSFIGFQDTMALLGTRVAWQAENQDLAKQLWLGMLTHVTPGRPANLITMINTFLDAYLGALGEHSPRHRDRVLASLLMDDDRLHTDTLMAVMDWQKTQPQAPGDNWRWRILDLCLNKAGAQVDNRPLEAWLADYVPGRDVLEDAGVQQSGMTLLYDAIAGQMLYPASTLTRLLGVGADPNAEADGKTMLTWMATTVPLERGPRRTDSLQISMSLLLDAGATWEDTLAHPHVLPEAREIIVAHPAYRRVALLATTGVQHTAGVRKTSL